MRFGGELKRLRAQSVGEVSAYQLWVQFSGYVEVKVIQFFKQGPAYKREGLDPNKGSNQQ